jgi:hypothetical protein
MAVDIVYTYVQLERSFRDVQFDNFYETLFRINAFSLLTPQSINTSIV